MPELSPTDRAALEGIVHGLQSAWNAGDGPGFAAAFAEDADFVNIRGEHHKGRAAISAGHEAILRTVYAGSSYRSVLEAARLVATGVALVHVQAILDVPEGPLAGRHQARYSMVLTRTSGSWEIAAFHNTRETP
jgi:uncharacterized protein (TIGR02246 family)